MEVLHGLTRIVGEVFAQLQYLEIVWARLDIAEISETAGRVMELAVTLRMELERLADRLDEAAAVAS
ncbi:hypothetical protein GCM10009754_86130 [Amycolatopsis minnesotensis]|uniref:Uncharacterized protein n=1 Tax=Amycolatopsis minnesotensis TaxID=337894 RepID=A0ABN2SW31_9PSEU